MPRAVVTPELAATIHNLRVENRILAKDLATHIGKSRAFISRLEHEAIATIDIEALADIFQYILDDTPESVASLNKIYDALELKYSNKEINEQLWFFNFDTVRRYIPIPESLIDELNELITSEGISKENLLDRINLNEELTKEEIEDTTKPFNVWYDKSDSSHPFASSIKIHLEEEKYYSILNKDLSTATYMEILCIAYYLYKIINVGTRTDITEDEHSIIWDKTVTLLNKHKFYSITQRRQLLSVKKTKQEQEELLNTFDRENIEIVNDILNGFRIFSDVNVELANKRLNAFLNNMKSDLGFTMRIASLGYDQLEKTSVSNKQKLINEFEELIKKYTELTAEENSIELY